METGNIALIPWMTKGMSNENSGRTQEEYKMITNREKRNTENMETTFIVLLRIHITLYKGKPWA